MELSLIIPTYNEVKYISQLLDSLIVNDGLSKEIFITDGGSTDGTIEIIKNYIQKFPGIFLINNPEKYVSFGFNKAYKLSKGKYISLIGAHALYPEFFFKTGISYLSGNECDVVGGPLLQKGKSITGKAIAYAMGTKFGVGGTEFRTENKKMFVDSVAFAIYKREVFEKVGLLDEELIRNQDDELHYRINAAGLKILMVPEMACTYFVRDSLKKLFTQYFFYGFYKPLVLKKVRSGIRMRHIVPSLFVFYLCSLPLIFISKYWLIPLLFYVLIAFYFSASNNLSVKGKFISFFVFPLLHISYGSGFITGIKKII